MEKFAGTEPSGCSFWRLAAAGKSFHTSPENHFNCAVGAYTHNIPLSPEREKETEQTLQMMFDLGYVKPEEVPRIPRLATTPAAIAYAPLGDATFLPDAVLFACFPLFWAAATRCTSWSTEARIGVPVAKVTPSIKPSHTLPFA
jgi:uncharacterized protein (DUF169 family)